MQTHILGVYRYEEDCVCVFVTCCCLFNHRPILCTSAGLNGQSTVRKVDVRTGSVLQSHSLPTSDFGEGVTRHGNRLYQLVWLKPTVWSYPVHNLGQDVKQHQSDLTCVCVLHCTATNKLPGMGGASRAMART